MFDGGDNIGGVFVIAQQDVWCIILQVVLWL